MSFMNINRTLFNVHHTVTLLRTIMVVEQYEDASSFTAATSRAWHASSRLIIAHAANSPSLRYHFSPEFLNNDTSADQYTPSLPTYFEPKIELSNPDIVRQFVGVCAASAAARLSAWIIVAVRTHLHVGSKHTLDAVNWCYYNTLATLGELGRLRWLIHNLSLEECFKEGLYMARKVRCLIGHAKAMPNLQVFWLEDTTEESWERVWMEGEILVQHEYIQHSEDQKQIGTYYGQSS
jgi:hypothetical protein